MKIRPLYDRILVKRIEEQSKTAGGLFIPDTAKEKPMEALVVAVGNGKVQENGSLRKLEVKAGDKILFSKYSGNEIKIDGTDHSDPARGRHPRGARITSRRRVLLRHTPGAQVRRSPDAPHPFKNQRN